MRVLKENEGKEVGEAEEEKGEVEMERGIEKEKKKERKEVKKERKEVTMTEATSKPPMCPLSTNGAHNQGNSEHRRRQ